MLHDTLYQNVLLGCWNFENNVIFMSISHYVYLFNETMVIKMGLSLLCHCEVKLWFNRDCKTSLI